MESFLYQKDKTDYHVDGIGYYFFETWDKSLRFFWSRDTPLPPLPTQKILVFSQDPEFFWSWHTYYPLVNDLLDPIIPYLNKT